MKNIKNFAQMRAQTLLTLFILLFAGIGQIGAVENSPVRQGAQSQPLQQVNTMTTGTYTGTVYEPFSTATPASYSPTAASPRPGSIRRGTDSEGNWVPDAQDLETAGDTGQSKEFPIGEPWILALFAAAFAGIIAFRKKQQI